MRNLLLLLLGLLGPIGCANGPKMTAWHLWNNGEFDFYCLAQWRN